MVKVFTIAFHCRREPGPERSSRKPEHRRRDN